MNRFSRLASMSELAREHDEAMAYDDLVDQYHNAVEEHIAFQAATPPAALMTATERTGVPAEVIAVARNLPAIKALVAKLDTSLKLHTYLVNLKDELRADPNDFGNAVLFGVLANEVKERDDIARDEEARAQYKARQLAQLNLYRRMRDGNKHGGISALAGAGVQK